MNPEYGWCRAPTDHVSLLKLCYRENYYRTTLTLTLIVVTSIMNIPATVITTRPL